MLDECSFGALQYSSKKWVHGKCDSVTVCKNSPNGIHGILPLQVSKRMAWTAEGMKRQLRRSMALLGFFLFF